MKQYKFIILTQDESGRRSLKPLPGQAEYTGADVIADKAVLDHYPVGTVFATDNIFLTNDGKLFATNPYPYPVDLPNGMNLGKPAKKDDNPNDIFSAFGGEDTTAYVEPLPEHAAVDKVEGQQMLDAFSEFCKSKRYTDATAKKADPANPANETLLQKIIKECPIPSIQKYGFFVEPRVWRILMRNIRKHGAEAVNTILYGETGTGKTELVKLAAATLGIPCRIYDMGSMYDPLTQMLGTHRLKDGASQFDLARFAQDVQSPGIILLDEITRADPAANNILLQCLDDRRSLNIEQASGESARVISVHPECVFVATANYGAQYTGTNELDEALRNRFMSVKIKGLQREDEVNLLVKRCGIAKKDATNIADCIDTLRNMSVKGELSTSVSTRESLEVANLVADGWSVTEALLDALEYKFDEEEQQKVRICIQKY